MSGSITVANVGTGVTLKTMSGRVTAADVGADSSLITMSGDVQVHCAHPSVSLETMSGNVYENGVKRRKEHAAASTASIVVSGGAVSFVSGAQRWFVNGSDVTRLVRGGDAATSAPKDEPPVRYQRGGQ